MVYERACALPRHYGGLRENTSSGISSDYTIAFCLIVMMIGSGLSSPLPSMGWARTGVHTQLHELNELNELNPGLHCAHSFYLQLQQLYC